MLTTFQELGRDLFLTGLVSSHTGSMSIRVDGRALISRSGAMLGRLAESDLVEFPFDEQPPAEAAEDVLVHQAIYRSTDAKAVIYARPPCTMALALVEDRLSPAHDEGAEALGSAPVLISQRPISSPDVAQLIAMTLRESRIVALRGHGVFARGEDLADALHMVSLLEEMCKVTHLLRTLLREEPQPFGVDRFERPAAVPYRPRGDGYNRRGGPRPAPQRGPGPLPLRREGPPRRPPYEPRSPAGGHHGPPPR